MNKLSGAVILFAAIANVAYGEDWSGKLIDATCSDQQQQQKTISCDATKTTTAFALNVAGTIYKLDAPGNTKAIAAMKYRPDPDPQKITEVKAKVTGTEAGGRILVDSIGLE